MYMNLTLADAEEIEEDNIKAKYGQVLIRGNNILWIQIPEQTSVLVNVQSHGDSVQPIQLVVFHLSAELVYELS